MKYYAIIDTNVLVSALLRWDSLPGTVAAESLTGRITPLLNTEILAEYREVLNRPKFHFPKSAVEVLLTVKHSPASSAPNTKRGHPYLQ